MTRDRGIPNRRVPKASHPRDRRRSASSSAKPRYDRLSRPTSEKNSSAIPQSPQSETLKQQTLSPKRPSSEALPLENWQNMLRGWKLAVILGLVGTTGLTALSLGFLFKLPAVPNCPSIFGRWHLPRYECTAPSWPPISRR
ncbi:MAG: hypothetical protein HC780_18755 [Leptolyngbyaceae cyanobacterium CSU_1_3]|nr:hypothetical protein [Leptolyngbyaceae cyanobacterium CSU_1_3]